MQKLFIKHSFCMIDHNGGTLFLMCIVVVAFVNHKGRLRNVKLIKHVHALGGKGISLEKFRTYETHQQ